MELDGNRPIIRVRGSTTTRRASPGMWRSTSTPVHEQVLAACAKNPDAVALDFLGGKTSFGQLAKAVRASPVRCSRNTAFERAAASRCCCLIRRSTSSATMRC